MANQRASDQAFYTNNINNAPNGAVATLNAVGRSLNNAGYNLANSAVGLFGLATDGDLQLKTMSSIASGVSNAANHPLDMATAIGAAGVNYWNNTSVGQMGEDALSSLSVGAVTFGAGKALGAVGSIAKDAAEVATELGVDTTEVGETVAPNRVAINSFDEYKTISSNPLQPNTIYEYSGAEFETDSLGRSFSTRGTIDTSNPGQRLPTVDQAIGNQADALSTDVGFHRGADSLGFPGGNLNVNPGNGFPIPDEFPNVPNLNGGAYRQLENTLRNLSNSGNSVYGNFESIFNDGNLTQRPDAFRVTYSVNGGIPRVRSFLNQPGG